MENDIQVRARNHVRLCQIIICPKSVVIEESMRNGLDTVFLDVLKTNSS